MNIMQKKVKNFLLKKDLPMKSLGLVKLVIKLKKYGIVQKIKLKIYGMELRTSLLEKMMTMIKSLHLVRVRIKRINMELANLVWLNRLILE